MTWSRTHASYLPSSANMRDCRFASAKRTQKQRLLGRLIVGANDPPPLPVVVTLVRIAPEHLATDDDNLAYAFKAVRDGVADAYGINDRDPRIAWRYREEIGPKSIRIEIAVRT